MPLHDLLQSRTEMDTLLHASRRQVWQRAKLCSAPRCSGTRSSGGRGVAGVAVRAAVREVVPTEAGREA
eukprot:13441763-Alexandrium_andersonii.AAC.1